MSLNPRPVSAPRIASAGLAVALLAGCGSQTFSTTASPKPDTTVFGLPYFLPRASLNVSFKGTRIPPPSGKSNVAGTYQLTTTIDPTPTYTGDPDAQLFLSYNHSSWSDDQFLLGVDQNGLLQTTSATSTDRTKDVALKVAELIGQIAKAASGLPPMENGYVARIARGDKTTPPPPRCTLPDFAKTFTFFPDEPAPTEERFGTGAQTVTVSVAAVADPGSPGPAALSPAWFTSDASRRAGIAFRRSRVIRYNTTIDASPEAKRACGVQDETTTQFVTIPDRRPEGLYWQDLSRGRLVTKTVKLTIINGMLTGLDVNSPSEVLAAVSLPSDLLKALISIPASVLNFKVEQIGAQQNLADAQTKALQSRLDLIQKQAEVQQAQAAAQQ